MYITIADQDSQKVAYKMELNINKVGEKIYLFTGGERFTVRIDNCMTGGE